jgi:hypothetical protein
LQRINCEQGGAFADVNMTVAAFPGEVLYLQVIDASAPANPNNTQFGFCISVDCPAKPDCKDTTISVLSYNAPQCWNMDVNGTNMNPVYYDCLPGSNNSANYFTFSTNCDGTPYDTVSLIFSVTDIGCGQTAMSLMRDNTLCDGIYEEIVVNCAVFEQVTGGTTASNFFQTYVLPACQSYVLQIISDENNGACAASGQVLVTNATIPPTTALPVELKFFMGETDGVVNTLYWTTLSEINTMTFVVERSFDAVNFEAIGTVAAAGNSNLELSYSLIDEHPQIGNNYYRLKTIDIDGSFEYSEIINLKITEDDLPATDGILKIYPNPTNGLLNIQYQASHDVQLDLQIYDVTGRNMLNKKAQVTRGINIIPVNAHQLANGMYILNLLDPDRQERHQAKFVKE